MRISRNTEEEEKRKRRQTKILPFYMQEKLMVGFVFLILLFAVLSSVIFGMVRKNSEEYSRIVLGQRQSGYGSRSIQARRGDILDRNGTILATSEKVYNLIVDPRAITSRSDDRYEKAVVDALREYFKGDERVDTVSSLLEEQKKLSTGKKSAYFKFKEDMSFDEKDAFQKFMDEKNAAYRKSGNKYEIKGLSFEDKYKRSYPYKELACNVIGFSSQDNSGGTGGVEQYYNNDLIGTNGREYGYLDSDTKLQSVIREASDGDSIVTTLNFNIQRTVEKYLQEWQKEDVGSKMAAAIVMNPNNGEILAMASTNQFDLNHPRELDKTLYPDALLTEYGKKEALKKYKREHDGKEISEDALSTVYTPEEISSLGAQVAWNQMWRNVAVSDTYEPGSTAKPFTIAGALEENAIVPSTQFTCDGYIKISDGVHTWTIRCHKRDGHGTLDAEQALMQSCNVYLMDTAFQEGAENFVKYQHIFGFGEKTGIDLPGEADTKDLIYTADTLGKTSLATNSFGQNYNVSMIQMAAGFSSIVNGGSYYKPHVVKQILNANGTVIKDVEPELVRVTNSKSTSDFLKEALYQTVEQGTGRPAKIQGYHVGGKTGTAQKLPRSEKNYLVSFCGFAPVEDPELLVYVIVDTPNLEGEAQASASFATKIEQKIMKDALQFLNIPPQGETDPEDSLNKNLEEEKKENAKEADKAEGNSEDEKQDSDEEVPDNLPESTKNEEN
ncbi:MAG: penicillin-binding protein 2 [Lachnospiraceae bacterium]|nr:penicillin-binding protein 2 [Lachnospiraceae bacterium]